MRGEGIHSNRAKGWEKWPTLGWEPLRVLTEVWTTHLPKTTSAVGEGGNVIENGKQLGQRQTLGNTSVFQANCGRISCVPHYTVSDDRLYCVYSAEAAVSIVTVITNTFTVSIKQHMSGFSSRSNATCLAWFSVCIYSTGKLLQTVLSWFG